MDPRFRKRTLAVLVALVVVCTTSAVTAILALLFANRTGGLVQRTADDVATLNALHLALARLAQAGERVLLAGEGGLQFRELTREAEQARQRQLARARGAASTAMRTTSTGPLATSSWRSTGRREL